MPRSMLALLGTAVLVASLAGSAWARDAIVVLDRGQASAADGERHAEVARRVVGRLREQGVRARLVVYGTRKSGRIRAAELRGDPGEALTEASEREGWAFEGATDPRVALELAARRAGQVESLDLFLIGAFGGEGGDEERATESLAAWVKKAPDDVRIYPLFLSPARRGLLDGAQSQVLNGAIILAVGEAEVRPRPWSPLAAEGDPACVLQADIRVPYETATVGTGPGEDLLTVASAQGTDAFERVASAPEGDRFSMTRPGTADRVATLRFVPSQTPGVRWLAEPPPPKTFQWTELRRDARLRSKAGGPALPYVVTNAQVGEPLAVSYRLVRTRAGPAPAYAVRTEGREEMPLGLDVSIGREVVADDATAFRDVVVSFAATAARPLEAEGTLVLEADDEAWGRFRIPYRVRVPPGRVAVRLLAPDQPVPLPPSEGDDAWSLRIEAKNANVPSHVSLRARTEPPEAAAALALVLAAGAEVVRWKLSEVAAVRPDVAYSVIPDVANGAGGVEAKVEVWLAEQTGVVGAAEGSGRVRPRRPAVVVAPDPWVYRLENGSVVGAPPMRLELDADGGTGDWRLALLGVRPKVSVPPGAPTSWEIRSADVGEWLLVPQGPWHGDRPEAFGSRTETLSIRIDWPAGGAPGAVRTRVEIPPRWGAAGWILVVLAGLALALGTWGILQLRPAPMEGTLLYAVADRTGTVGRLDLAPLGRRTKTVRTDAAGRLRLGGAGDAVCVLRPTRVGGLLVVSRDGSRQEHLLVDGLTVSVGRHRIRYLSGREDDGRVAPAQIPGGDLLGPEYDLPTGRIDSLPTPSESTKFDASPEAERS